MNYISVKKIIYSLIILSLITVTNCYKDSKNLIDSGKFNYSSEKEFVFSMNQHFEKFNNKKAKKKLKDFEFKFDENIKIDNNDYVNYVENNPSYVLQVIRIIEKKDLNKEKKEKIIFDVTQAFIRYLNNFSLR
jgi:hypothetical protein